MLKAFYIKLIFLSSKKLLAYYKLREKDRFS